MTYPTEEGFYWVRVYEDWDYDTRIWSDLSDEWTIAQIKLADTYDNKYKNGRELDFWLLGDEMHHDDFDMIAEWEKIEAHK